LDEAKIKLNEAGMASGKLLRQLIRSGVEEDNTSFRRISEAVIAEERQKHHNLLANDLEKILYGSDSLNSSRKVSNLNQNIPVDKERGLPLVELKEPVRGLEDVVLADVNGNSFKRILKEYNREEVLRSWGMRPVERVLFCGPPGCGKTISAEALAFELNRPLCVIRLDSVVSSYLGETSANLRKVFDFIQSSPVVALFDEFDALGKERADVAEHGELKRVVNTFLQMLDSFSGQSLIIAATNHESILDSAIWRRFEEILVFEYPTVAQVKSLLAIKLRGVRREFEYTKQVTDLFKNISHADIERILKRSIKDMLLEGQEFLNLEHIQIALKSEKARVKSLNKSTTKKTAK
jgi:SpoVK/Ycf46/Vps4 family AAA+-type ATPase